jgi:AcrR family transcriptional regulator
MTAGKKAIDRGTKKTRSKAVGIRTRLDAEVRSKMIAEAAFKAIAKDGFEGLRTRDIARLVGINSATLHHHFPTKENLIEGVANLLENRFRAEARAVENENAVEALNRQLKDAITYYVDRPEMLAVYREFVGRAPRDPAIRRLVQRLHAAWHADVAETLKKGKNEGSFRADLDVESAARIVISTVWGLVAQIFSTKNDFKTGFHELTKWLVAEQSGKGSTRTKRGSDRKQHRS